jgi:FMN phosphatase YigB (HAD superfamily)
MGKTTAVIFDLGNVILFFDHHIVSRRLAKQHGLEKEFVYRKIFLDGLSKDFDLGKVSPERFTEQCSAALKVNLDLLKFREAWSEIFTENVPVIEMAREVKKKSKLLLLSNTNIWHFEYIRDNFQVLDLFDDFVLSFEIGYSKPHRRIFERAIGASGDSELIVYFDDIAEYANAARQYGISGHQYLEEKDMRQILRDMGLL